MNDLSNNLSDTMTGEVHFLVPDVHCANCCLKIEKALGQLEDIEDVNVNYAEKRLTFYSPSSIATNHAISRLDELGYSSSPETPNEGLVIFQEERRRLLARLGVAGIGMMQVMMFAMASYVAGPSGIDPAYQGLMHWASLIISIPIVFYSAMPFHKGALRDIRNLSPGMDVPVSLAILSAFSLSTFNTLTQTGEVYFDSACMFTFFLLTGRYLELTARHAFHVDQSLGEHLLPELAHDLKGNEIAVDQLNSGDMVRIGPGDIVPADAIVTSGLSSVDESAFTGEGDPVLKTVGAKVLAGTTNLDGQFDARVLGTKATWVISHLSEQYKKSASFRPKLAVLADVVARYFVAIILILSMLTGLYWWTEGADNFFAIALAVLVVSCPCALSLATPVAYTIASGAVRKLGLLISEGAFLEKLSAVNAVVFDKTGTLTEGTLKLEQNIPLSDELGEDKLLQIAASLEVSSLHPVAVTLRAETDEILPVKNLDISPGYGVSGQIEDTRYWLGKPTFAANADIEAPNANYNWVLLARSGEPGGSVPRMAVPRMAVPRTAVPLCWFGFSDRLREGAETVIEQTKVRMSQVEVFSGDKSDAGRDRVRSLGIALPSMDMTPEQKIEGLRKLHHQGKTVLMVGDGLNDAGAMAASDISIAVNPVDTVVQSAADATLVNGDLSSLPELFDYATRVKHVIRQNLIWAFTYNLSVIPLAMAGVIAPWAAALGMSASSLLVTLNACRLARTK